MLRLTLVPGPYTHPQGSELLLGQEADSPQETLVCSLRVQVADCWWPRALGVRGTLSFKWRRQPQLVSEGVLGAGLSAV